MEQLKPTDKIDVQALQTLLLQRRSSRKPTFKLPATHEQARVFLTEAMRFEVEERFGTFCEDVETLQHLGEIATYLTEVNARRFGIMICGACGNGKTTTMKAIQTTVQLFSSGDFFTERLLTRWVDAKDVERIARGSQKDFHSLRSTDLLFIDDIGRESTEVLDYGNVTSPIVDLFEYRYAERLYTIVTTNKKPSEMRQKYGERVADRFNEMFHVINYTQKSYRK